MAANIQESPAQMQKNTWSAVERELKREVEQVKARADTATPTIKNETPASVGFPFDVFPIEVQELITAAQTAQGAPPEYVAACMLWSAATATGNAIKIKVKDGTIEPAILFLGIVGPPNAAKTPALSLVLRPLHEANKDAFDKYKLAKATAKAEAKEDKGKPERTPLDKVLLGDATPEALAAAHYDRLRGIGTHCDELAGKIKSFDRYNSGGEMDTWLSLWSAEPMTIDRKTSDPILISKPFVGIIGGIQPARLEGLAADDRAVSGFLDRFLFVWPDNLLKPDWTLAGMDYKMPLAWKNAINKLLNLPFGEDADNVVEIHDSARKTLFDWFNKTNKPRCISATNERLSGMYGKFDTHTNRLILALHLLRFAYSGNTTPGDVDEATVKDGIRLAEYFISQSEKVHKQIFDTCAVDKLPRNVRQWYGRLKKLKGIVTTDRAVKAGEMEELSESTVKRWLGRKDLFDKVKHGEYLPIL